jgi:hypothetical protein
VTLETGIRYGALIASVGIAWDAVELLSARELLLERFFGWRVIRYAHPSRLRRLLGPWMEGRAFGVLVALHAIAAIAFPFVLLVSRPLAACLAALVLAVHLVVRLRLTIGMDGADNMQTILWSGFLIYAVDLGHPSNVAAAIFIVSQLILAYVVAGLAKLGSARWRDGSAIGMVMAGRMYSTPAISRALQRKGASAVVGAGVIGWETLGASVLLGGRFGLIAFLVMGSAFHIGIAIVLGLITFAFAFLAAYPVLYALIS